MPREWTDEEVENLIALDAYRFPDGTKLSMQEMGRRLGGRSKNAVNSKLERLREQGRAGPGPGSAIKPKGSGHPRRNRPLFRPKSTLPPLASMSDDG